jgi:hypothetical protein
MPPKRQTNDTLSNNEKELIGVAVRLDAALRYRLKNKDSVNQAWYVGCIGEELVCIPFLFCWIR